MEYLPERHNQHLFWIVYCIVQSLVGQIKDIKIGICCFSGHMGDKCITIRESRIKTGHIGEKCITIRESRIKIQVC